MCFGLDLVCSGRELVQVLDVYLSWVVSARIIPVPVLFVPVARWRFSIRMISTKDVSTGANFLFCCWSPENKNNSIPSATVDTYIANAVDLMIT